MPAGYDRAASVPARNSVALVAALRRVTTNADRLTLFYVTPSGQKAPIDSYVMAAREGVLADQLRVVPAGVSLIQVQDQGGDILASGTLTDLRVFARLSPSRRSSPVRRSAPCALPTRRLTTRLPFTSTNSRFELRDASVRAMCGYWHLLTSLGPPAGPLGPRHTCDRACTAPYCTFPDSRESTWWGSCDPPRPPATGQVRGSDEMGPPPGDPGPTGALGPSGPPGPAGASLMTSAT